MERIDSYLVKVWDYVDRGENITMEAGLFRMMTLAVSLLCILCVLPVNLMQNLPQSLNWIILLYGLLSFCFYLAACSGRQYTKLFYAASIIVLNAAWFLNAGSAGSIDYFFFAIALFPMIFFRGSSRLISLLLLMLNNWVLLVVEQSHPALVVPYASPMDRILDLSSGFSFAAVTCALMFWMVVTAHERELKARKKTEELLGKANQQLDLRVQKRTAELEFALKEQEAFSYSVSHDLRAPLRHMNSYLALLAEEYGELLPEAAHGYLNRSREASTRMGRLIDELLELSRISRATVMRSAIDVTQMGNEICQGMLDSEPARGVEVQISEGLTGSGDQTLIRQMLENLLGNAWKYTARKDGARIELGKELVGGREMFYVRDNGVGFDMAYSDMLFAPFQRLHGAEFDGNGVGLATVKRILERHGGEISARSAPGEGATFYFTF